MSEQNERAYQKQAQIFQNRKGTSKGLKARYWRNPGLGFKIPLEAKNGTYIDKKCPFTGSVSIRGRIVSGQIIKKKMHRTVVIRRDYLIT